MRIGEDLDRETRRALEACNILRRGEDYWYAPSGDGGVVCLTSTRNAWAFAKELRASTSDRIPIRIGIGIAPIVIMPDGLPVGCGVMLADELSGLPSDGEICCSQRFWTEIEESGGTKGWTAAAPEDADDPDALLLSDGSNPLPRAVDESESLENYREKIEGSLKQFPNEAAVGVVAKRLNLEPSGDMNELARRISEFLISDRGTGLDEEIGELAGLRSDWTLSGNEGNVNSLNRLLGWILPLRFDQQTVRRIRKEIEQRETVVRGTATRTGMKICLARQDGQDFRFGNEPVLKLSESPLSKPESDVLLILKDLANQLELDAHPQDEDEADLVAAYGKNVSAILRGRRIKEKRTYYCFVEVDQSERASDSGKWKTLQQIRKYVPQLLFVSLDPKADTLEFENVVVDLLRDLRPAS